MKKYLLLLMCILVAAVSMNMVFTSNDVAANAIYTCPTDQVQGRAEIGQDVRYCYIKKCPVGEFGNPADPSGGNDVTKCYKYEVVDGRMQAIVTGDAQLGRIAIENTDGMKCPGGSYRGGIKSGQDPSKCYTCDVNGCQDADQPVVPEHYEACLKTNRSCIRAQERAHVQYMKELRDAAPRGFELPANSELVVASSAANKFCRYYRNMEWQTHYGPQYLYQACLIGYEVGFGGGRVCSKEYLFGHDATHRSAPTLNAQGFRDEAMRLPQAKKDLMTSDAIKACQDGWAQYSVDYWYCEDDASCQNSLRKDKSRVINPGPRPNKTKYVNEDGEEVETYNTVTTSQSCGSVQSAYFACGLGRGIQNSSFWQIIEMILNILIGLVGIAAVGGLVYGGIRYSAAGDNSTQVSEAKTIIKNVIIGVVLFLVMWAFIQYMIPGGIFSSS